MDERLEDRVARLEADPRVAALWVFGSRARGEGTSRSDLDLALLPTRRLTLDEELELRGRVQETLASGRVDLVLLDRAAPVLCYEVIAGGRRLLTRDHHRADRFEESSLRRYMDTAHLRRVQRELAREALR